jgi:hypothetical protein
MHTSRLRALGAMMFLVLAACSQKKPNVARTDLETLDAALAPTTIAASLRKLGGAHFHATAMFRVDAAGKKDANDGSKPASPSVVTTTTDLWMDKQGNFRLVESNDQDGGREVVRVGNEVAVALRYGKMIRRSTQDTESSRFLTEALGAPWAAWELARCQVEVERGNSGAHRLKLGPRLVELPKGLSRAEGLRGWRETVDVKTLDGQVTLDAAGHAVRAFACKMSFVAVRAGLPVEGAMDVVAAVDQAGAVADIVLPEADTLHPRQRTVLEERALLPGLGASLSSANK